VGLKIDYRYGDLLFVKIDWDVNENLEDRKRYEQLREKLYAELAEKRKLARQKLEKDNVSFGFTVAFRAVRLKIDRRGKHWFSVLPPKPLD
jgi:hypothetical protein